MPRTRTVTLALALALTLPGCIQMRMHVKVNPDGSGKVTFLAGVKSGMTDLLESFGEGDGAQDLGKLGDSLSAESLAENSEGIVAWSGTREYQEGGYEYFEVTGYFDDIEKVRLETDDDDPDGGITFDFSRRDDGTYVLGFEPSPVDDLIGGEDEDDDPAFESEAEKRMAKGLMKSLMGDFHISYTFELPGAIREARGMAISGRQATIRYDLDEMFQAMDDPVKAREAVGNRVISGPDADGIEDEMVEFRKELKEVRARREAARATDPSGPRRLGWY